MFFSITQIKIYFFVVLMCIGSQAQGENIMEHQEVRYPDDCEACRFFSMEFEKLLEKSSKYLKMIETGYSIDEVSKKRIRYDRSDLLLIEILEQTCNKIFEYKVHKQYTDINRFARGHTDTFKSLHNLVKQGVQVDIGIPFEMWDAPTNEIVELRSKCSRIVETYDDLIEEWYHGSRELTLENFLCRDRILPGNDKKCLTEALVRQTETLADEIDIRAPVNGDGSKGGVRIA